MTPHQSHTGAGPDAANVICLAMHRAATARPACGTAGARLEHRVLLLDGTGAGGRLAAALRGTGAAVTVMTDEDDALDALEQEAFGLIVAATGDDPAGRAEFVKLFRFLSLGGPHVPVVAVTGAAPGEAGTLMAAGADACMDLAMASAHPAALIEAVFPGSLAAGGAGPSGPPPATLPGRDLRG